MSPGRVRVHWCEPAPILSVEYSLSSVFSGGVLLSPPDEIPTADEALTAGVVQPVDVAPTVHAVLIARVVQTADAEPPVDAERPARVVQPADVGQTADAGPTGRGLPDALRSACLPPEVGH